MKSLMGVKYKIHVCTIQLKYLSLDFIEKNRDCILILYLNPRISQYFGTCSCAKKEEKEKVTLLSLFYEAVMKTC